MAYYALGEVEKAVAGLVRAIEIDPGSQVAHFQLGVAFAEAGIFREALREWLRVVAIDATSAAAEQARRNVATVRTMLGEEAER
jgi:tetratricopeptide (TPR) repeat protein